MLSRSLRVARRIKPVVASRAGFRHVGAPMALMGSRRIATEAAAIGLAGGAPWLAAGLVVGGLATYLVFNKGVDYNAVRADIAEVLDAEDYDDGSYGPFFVRLAWHASGTYSKEAGDGGSDGATMRFGPEANFGANAGLGQARDLLQPIKDKYPELSYADLWTLAGVVAIEEMGGPKIPWRSGRTDAVSEKACPPDGRLPDGDKGPQHVRDIFYRMGFNDQEIVALVGAHALGRCHKDRSGFDGPWTRAPTTFSNELFRLLLEDKWTKRPWSGNLQYENVNSGKDLMMLESDMALVKDEEFRKWVKIYAEDEEKFFADFSDAFSRLLELGWKQ